MIFDSLPPEHRANFTEGGPVVAACEFMAAIFEARNLRRAWPLIDSALRLTLVTAWLEANEGHPALADVAATTAASLADEEPIQTLLWEAYAETQLGEFTDEWARFRVESWGVATKPRIVALGLEQVVFVPLAGLPPIVTKATAVPDAIVLLMRHDGDIWRVAGLQTDEPAPGGFEVS